MIGELDLHLFAEGTHTRLYEKLGAHAEEGGTSFAVWAPNAAAVRVFGDFNGWDPDAQRLERLGDTGIWVVWVRGARPGHRYKYRILPAGGGPPLDKADPFAFWCEPPPGNASVVWDLDYTWEDSGWMAHRAGRNSLAAPVSVYEVHLGSWKRGEGGRPLSYREVAPRLAEYVREGGFTHVEFLPVMEHPFYGSWGYQVTGYFAPTSRYGTPQDFMYLVDTLHQAGVGVVLDWVPSHFATDPHGLARFDGSALYEHPDPRRGWHPDWGSAIFDYGRPQVRSFLLSSAHFWLDRYHADGLRVDAVASMLYLDYWRREGEWLPNEYGGRENLDAIRFLRELNESVYRDFPDVQTFAEESTAWPLVSRPTSVGGLGFGLKWDMGWMHDTLRYLARDPVHRKYHHEDLTFRMLYAFSENFLLPLSHDEMVHGKGSLWAKMAGDAWQKFAHLRLLLGYQYAQPGKKLLFMGGEFGQRREWDHDGSLDWHLLEDASHGGVHRWVRDLNRLYRAEPALHQLDCEPEGFEWIHADDREASVLSFVRRDRSGRWVAVVCNFTPVPRTGYRIGLPKPGRWVEVLNSDAREYGGSGWGNFGGVRADEHPCHGRPYSVELVLPPLGILFLRWEGSG
ncbi:1,4-alpha-glucan branching enzyme GlgB [bacterium HR32]|nr:1,4-alpha-glucan branching enzyme GlgB [bacterium HR32]